MLSACSLSLSCVPVFHFFRKNRAYFFKTVLLFCYSFKTRGFVQLHLNACQLRQQQERTSFLLSSGGCIARQNGERALVQELLNIFLQCNFAFFRFLLFKKPALNLILPVFYKFFCKSLRIFYFPYNSINWRSVVMFLCCSLPFLPK